MLYIIATPIGNLEDITLRALKVLKEVDTVLAEDTRKTGFLLAHFGIKKQLVSLFEHNEVKKIPWLIQELSGGKNMALVSDGGMPTLCDPGYKLIRECREKHIALTVLPGASSITSALACTSVPHDKFAFIGYLPRKHNERKKVFEKVISWGCAIVFFESPYRVLSALKDINEFVGNRRVAIAREMTKKFEEIIECNLEDAIRHFEKTTPRGEFTVILDAHQA
ncbi:MAG: 16S rRNA (cytidine(1402)-2'-O)-methyltransferase [Candidatus Omnitrophota bacterium]